MKFGKSKLIVAVGLLCASASSALANEEAFDVRITSLSNTRGNAAMEVCGSAKHKDGKWPLVVTVRHDASFYSTMTSPKGSWCALVKRWTFSGRVYAVAASLDGESSEELETSEAVKPGDTKH